MVCPVLVVESSPQKVAVRMLSDESESEITIPDLTVPKSSNSVVDAYGRLDNGCLVVFNFTVNLKHDIASNLRHRYGSHDQR